MEHPATRLAWRAFTHRAGDPGRAGEVDVRVPMASAGGQKERGFTTGGGRPYPCSSDDLYCVVEEYTFF